MHMTSPTICVFGNDSVEVGRVWSREEVSQKVILKILTGKVFISIWKLHHFIDKYGFKEVF